MAGGRASMSAYSRAKRDCFEEVDGPGPSDYDLKNTGIIAKCETVAPFDTSAGRSYNYETPGRGPIYFPFKRDLWQHGSPLFRWRSRLPPDKVNFNCADPVWGRIPDPWALMTQYIKDMDTKRPRVPFVKHVSNCVPSTFHSRDIRCFILGIDGRMYPWSMERRHKCPGPKYDTYKVYTSASKITPKVNFGAMAARKDLFPAIPGFGPADFVIRKPQTMNGGNFLGKSCTDPYSSAPRLFSILEKQVQLQHIPCSSATMIPSQFMWFSPKAVSAPFKSKTPQGLPKPLEGPSPAEYFKQKVEESDVHTNIVPGIITFPPEKAPFETSQERFHDMEKVEQDYRPSPNAYTIPGFTDEMERDLIRHAAAIPNPKLGFLTSADARPGRKLKKNEEIVVACKLDAPREWRNMRPKRGVTYSYFGRPPKYPDSPGPIYDTCPGYAAVKARKSWWDPRCTTRTGFLNSGVSRLTQCYTFDKNTPGPGLYYSSIPCCRKEKVGKIPSHGPRFLPKYAEGPGPKHKLHEKADSMWRAGHLGTFNADLKGLGVVYPWAGGFIKKNLNIATDKLVSIIRPDDYADLLCTADTSLLKKC